MRVLYELSFVANQPRMSRITKVHLVPRKPMAARLIPAMDHFTQPLRQ
jgi:hypothetical protein